MNDTIKQGKTAAIVSYITIVGTLIALSMNSEPKNEFARFHIRQAFGLWVAFFALAFLVSFANSLYATFGFYIFFMILLLYGFTGALAGKKQTVPLLGKYFQQWFSFIS
ncbi:hypothetical protein [Sinomicrobium weinanense]|uniref:DUF4870 domain-containing protein n=1 Tax=Sinomicrobium weinanense TaxID=2842200 RepID=A0A926JNU7_9FLAO|nr:hypothetical protein [Sinomicrobium weinanense]MBC9794728.1 hypothetical protein [Sinomicrobium weinanense]MBU3124987.1 hypothetical protein [Sinomicrobium weinanense]